MFGVTAASRYHALAPYGDELVLRFVVKREFSEQAAHVRFLKFPAAALFLGESFAETEKT